MTDERNKAVHAAVARLLTALGIDWERDANYRETPSRVTTWLLEKFPTELERETKRQLYAKKVFPSNYDGVITQTGIKVYGVCPHHLKDIVYDVSIGYVPYGAIIGLSKLARLAELELGVSGTQEDLTKKLAEVLCVVLHTEDVAVVVKGRHNCMVSRGVRQSASVTVTSEMYGKFRKNNADIKGEFLDLVHVNGGK